MTARRHWAGSDADVVDALSPHVLFGAHIVRAFVTARTQGANAADAISIAHFGQIGPSGSMMASSAGELAAKLDRVVAWRRSLGDNVL